MLSQKFFHIKNDINLFPEDYKVLHLLYNPLIGLNSLGLYQTLYFLSFENSKKSFVEYQHLFLFDLLNIQENDFLKFKEKLEALGLLNTFKNDKDDIIYVINPPLKSHLFLQDPILNPFLLSEIGYSTYVLIFDYFQKTKDTNMNNYQNISKKFKDIYDFQRINLKEDLIYSKYKKNLGKSFFESDFDYEMFLNYLPERFKKPVLVEWNTIDYLKKLSFVYGLTPKSLADIYISTFHKIDDDKINLKMLSINLNKKDYQKYCNTKMVFYKKNDNDDKEMIIFLKNTSPQRIIKKYCNNNYRSSVSETVFNLMERNDIEKGIINALLIYILKFKEGILPTVPYLEKVLQSWFKRGIISTEAAYDFLIEDEKRIQKNNKYKKNKPDWLKDIQKK